MPAMKLYHNVGLGIPVCPDSMFCHLLPISHHFHLITSRVFVLIVDFGVVV